MIVNQGIRALLMVNWVTVSQQNCQICHFFSALLMYVLYIKYMSVAMSEPR